MSQQIVQSPFVQRALASELPVREYTPFAPETKAPARTVADLQREFGVSSDWDDDDRSLEAALDIGACAWGSGAYGHAGMVHIAWINGQREECCTFG